MENLRKALLLLFDEDGRIRVSGLTVCEIEQIESSLRGTNHIPTEEH